MTEGMPPELITASARDQEMAAVLDRLSALAGEGRLADGDVQAIRHLASRPKARRTARCPVCVLPDMFGTFTAETDADLFAMIASHVMSNHNGGGTDAFCTAERVLPHIGDAYRKGR
jgi:hypothetical protein